MVERSSGVMLFGGRISLSYPERIAAGCEEGLKTLCKSVCHCALAKLASVIIWLHGMLGGVPMTLWGLVIFVERLLAQCVLEFESVCVVLFCCRVDGPRQELSHSMSL